METKIQGRRPRGHRERAARADAKFGCRGTSGIHGVVLDIERRRTLAATVVIRAGARVSVTLWLAAGLVGDRLDRNRRARLAGRNHNVTGNQLVIDPVHSRAAGRIRNNQRLAHGTLMPTVKVSAPLRQKCSRSAGRY